MSELQKQLELPSAHAQDVVDVWYATSGSDDQKLIDAALEIATSYVESRLPFLVANSAMNRLMVRREWETPEDFWRLFVAFEDLEIEDEPGEKGRAHIRAALSAVCASNNSLKADVPDGPPP